MQRNIYFISESIPHVGYGSFVIFHRHLKRLKSAGYNIHLIIPDYTHINTDDYIQQIKNEWYILKLPLRKWWYPPYRFDSKILRYFRFKLLYFFCKSHLEKYPPHFIITYLHGEYLNGFAAFLKNQENCRMGVFLHDDKYLLHGKVNKKHLEYDQQICKSSNVIWSVTENLKIPNIQLNTYNVLPPIPEGYTGIIKNWNDKYLNPTIGFSGTLYEFYLPTFELLLNALKKHNGNLIIISKESCCEWLIDWSTKYENVIILPSFKENIDALKYLQEKCSALFCGYPISENKMLWAKSSFPSKFIEYSHLGLPIILSGNKNTYLNEWAKNNRWPLFIECFDQEAFNDLIKKISDETNWTNYVYKVNLFAKEQFNPEKIHIKFLNSIEALI